MLLCRSVAAGLMQVTIQKGSAFFVDAFKMQDTNGLPIEVTYDLCKEKGIHVDWLAALCQCWLNDCKKYESFVRQAELLTGVDLDLKFKIAGERALRENPQFLECENPVDECCKYILKKKGLHEKDNDKSVSFSDTILRS